MMYALVFVIGLNVGAVYAAWLLGGWANVRKLARVLAESREGGAP